MASMTIDEYFESTHATSEQKAEYARLQSMVRELAPEAEETVSYAMPAYKFKGQPLVYFGIFKDHMSYFPASGSATAELGDKLAPWKTAKGTLQFTLDNPVPDDILRDMIRYRLSEIG